MPDYKQMYVTLLGSIAIAISNLETIENDMTAVNTRRILKNAVNKAEDIYIDSSESTIND